MLQVSSGVLFIYFVVAKIGVVEQVLSFAQWKGKKKLDRMAGTKKKKLTGVAKLVDANLAGSAQSQKCTLILTEGDSAKALAVAGMTVVGHDEYGVFPLKGKLLNVRGAKVE
jgi:DNA topoisomerase-2